MDFFAPQAPSLDVSARVPAVDPPQNRFVLLHIEMHFCLSSCFTDEITFYHDHYIETFNVSSLAV